jgi:transcription antitermination factor NusG
MADEIVSGTFRNIAGTVSAIDVANKSLTVQDAIAKTSVVVKITADSQVK